MGMDGCHYLLAPMVPRGLIPSREPSECLCWICFSDRADLIELSELTAQMRAWGPAPCHSQKPETQPEPQAPGPPQGDHCLHPRS